MLAAVEASSDAQLQTSRFEPQLGPNGYFKQIRWKSALPYLPADRAHCDWNPHESNLSSMQWISCAIPFVELIPVLSTYGRHS